MRADARRNRERLLAAATQVILDVGGEPPLDAIARRAEVGIGTLYRHFPDRDRLLEAVALHALDQAVDAAQRALDEGVDGCDALRRYLHDAVCRGVGVLNLVHPLLDGPDWRAQRDRIAPLLDAIVARGRADGSVRPDLRSPDIVVAVIRFSRPVAVGLPEADERALAHRHLDVYVDGLGTRPPADRPLPDPPVMQRWPG